MDSHFNQLLNYLDKSGLNIIIYTNNTDKYIDFLYKKNYIFELYNENDYKYSYLDQLVIIKDFNKFSIMNQNRIYSEIKTQKILFCSDDYTNSKIKNDCIVINDFQNSFAKEDIKNSFEHIQYLEEINNKNELINHMNVGYLENKISLENLKNITTILKNKGDINIVKYLLIRHWKY